MHKLHHVLLRSGVVPISILFLTLFGLPWLFPGLANVVLAVEIGTWIALFLVLGLSVRIPARKTPAPVVLERAMQLVRVTWAALALALGGFLGAAIGVDLQNSESIDEFMETFLSDYVAGLVGLVFWLSLWMFSMLTAVDLIRAGPAARAASRDRIVALTIPRRAERPPFHTKLISRLWRDLTEHPLMLLFAGYILMPMLSVLYYGVAGYS